MQRLDLHRPPAPGETGVLVKLWREFLKDNNLIGTIPKMVDRYISRSKEQNDSTGVIKSKNKSIMYNNIGADRMTIKTFFDLHFNLINVKDMEITVTVTLPTGKKVTNNIKILPKDINYVDKELIDAINRATGADHNNDSSKEHANTDGATNKT